jgi:hypothetical protein
MQLLSHPPAFLLLVQRPEPALILPTGVLQLLVCLLSSFAHIIEPWLMPAVAATAC